MIPVKVWDQWIEAEVLYYYPGEPESEYCPGAPEEWEIELYSQQGTRMEWVEHVLADRDWESIQKQILKQWRDPEV